MDLSTLWYERAQRLRDWGANEAAQIWDLAALELQQKLEAEQQELLNLTESARESGYTADHLGHQVRTGKIPNAGRPNAPLIYRADLPIKPGPRRRISGTEEITAEDLR